MPEPGLVRHVQDQHQAMSMWNMLWYSPLTLLVLLLRRFRRFVFEMIKKSFGEGVDCVQRSEFIDAMKETIKRPEYDARAREMSEGQKEIREMIRDSEERLQASFHGSVQEHKKSVNDLDLSIGRRFEMLEKTFLDDRLRGKS